MAEISGSEFFESIAQTEQKTREYPLANSKGNYITVTLTEVERKQLFDELSALPDGFIDLMLSGAGDTDVEDLDDVDDAEDIDFDVDPAEVMANIDGDAIEVFENIFAMSAEHDDLTSLDFQQIAEELEFEALFEVGGEVIDLSLSESGEVERFREPGSDRSS